MLLRVRFSAIALAICCAAAALRLTGLWSDLWLDEIWSLAATGTFSSIRSVFTTHHEINHHLYSAWLYLVGQDASVWVYRLPSFLAGVATVFVAGLIGRRRNDTTALVTMLLVTVSYELVLFSSEARGYSIVILCTLLAYYFLSAQNAGRTEVRSAIGYVIAAITGILAQPIFAGVLAAACVWSAVRLWRTRTSVVQAATQWTMLQALPIAAAITLYVIDWRYVVAGGGTAIQPWFATFAGGFAWALGTPLGRGPVLITFIVLGVVMLLAGLYQLIADKSDDWIFFLCAIVIFPLVLVLARGSEFVYTRHFLPGSALLLVLLGNLLGAGWTRARTTVRLACAAVLVIFASTNALNIVQLAKYGRGQHSAAIWYMADHRQGDALVISGDQDFRILVELSYYIPRLLGSRPWTYVKASEWPAGGPEWIVVQVESFQSPVVSGDYTDRTGVRYELALDLPTAPLTGLHWVLYQRAR
jgi:hypothetical protein